MVQAPASEAESQKVEQPPAEEPAQAEVTAEQAETPEAEVQEKDVLADLPDDKLLEHPRIKDVLDAKGKEERKRAEKAIGKERRRIAQEERDRAQKAHAEREAEMRERLVREIVSEDDPEKRRELQAQLGVKDAVDAARTEGFSQAMSAWGAEGRLMLEDSGLLPEDAKDRAELQIRIEEKYGKDANFFQQTRELMGFLMENYVPKSEVDKLAAEKAEALRVSNAGQEAATEKTPVELPPTGGTVKDYVHACELFNEGSISAERFKELKRQFGVD